MFGIFAVAQKQNQPRHAFAWSTFARRANLPRALFASAAIAALLVTASCAGYITQNTTQPTSTNYTVATALGELVVYQLNAGEDLIAPDRGEQLWATWPTHNGYQLLDTAPHLEDDNA